MMGRLIGLIIIFAVLLAFIGFNLDNRCDISFGFTKIPEVPVFFTVFGSFVLGMLASVPFLISFAVKKKPPKERPASAGKQPEASAPSGGNFLD
jgi:uncharacterized integral membrane protein